uniref:Uncharacterized protein n=3 Tax=Acinetobacter baumannii TaxID=470 RepID=A0A482F399_ACIBA|nr:hypothetical protein [Acinetobacter baumannii]
MEIKIMINYMEYIDKVNQMLPIDNLTALQISIIWVCILLFSNGVIFVIFSLITFFIEQYHLIKLKKVKYESD